MQEDHDDAALQLEGFDPQDLEQEPPPQPTLPGTLEESVARYTGLARASAGRRLSAKQHSVIAALLAEDERRAAQASPYPWDQPLFRGAQGQAVLRALERLAAHWTHIGLRVTASGGRRIELTASAAGQSSRFEIRAAPASRRAGQRGRPSTRTALEFRIDPDPDARSKPDRPRWSSPRPIPRRSTP